MCDPLLKKTMHSGGRSGRNSFIISGFPCKIKAGQGISENLKKSPAAGAAGTLSKLDEETGNMFLSLVYC